MKLFIVFIFTMLVIGLCHGELSKDLKPTRFNRRPSKNFEIPDIDVIEEVLVPVAKAVFIINCKANGHVDVEDELQESFEELTVCLRKKTIFIDLKEDFITNIEECTQNPIRKIDKCLKEEQKYFPQLVLDILKSVVTFMYEDEQIIKVDLLPCYRRVQEFEIERKYLQCISDTAFQTHDTGLIPSSKESYCQKVIPLSRCVAVYIIGSCENSPKMVKLRKDILNSVMVHCV